MIDFLNGLSVLCLSQTDRADGFPVQRMSMWRSGEASDTERSIIVNRKILQLKIQNQVGQPFCVLSLDSSALERDFGFLRKVSIFRRMPCHWSFSMASSRERTTMFVINFQSIFRAPHGVQLRLLLQIRCGDSCCRANRIIRSDFPLLLNQS